ncbi:LuxR C-terminal-related transcriptional regulator [Paenibacillus nanensis]|nr:LuxR C-terminal-related transcriptional regulator [Paenibacillus nanensis]
MNDNGWAEDGEESYMVGREMETAAFSRLLLDESASRRVINVYGTAGIGKSTLLDKFRAEAHKAGAVTISIDGEGVLAAPSSFCDQIRRELKLPEWTDGDEHTRLLSCYEAIRNKAEQGRVVLLIDAYERFDMLDFWIRDTFLKGLRASALIVIAGRSQLSEPWLLSPVWRQQLVRMHLQELDWNAVTRYARNNGIAEETQIQRLWSCSKGHPLMLSLAAFLAQQGAGEETYFRDDDSLPFIVELWMREAPDEEMRALIEAAAVLRHFNQDALNAVLGSEVTASDFRRLIRYSFVRRVDDGFTIYSLMREAVCRDLILRAPQRYAELRERGLRLYYERLMSLGRIDASSREAVELMYYIGDALVRAFMDVFDLVPKHYAKTGIEALDEIEAYAARRKREAKDLQILLHDPQSKLTFDFSMTAEQSLYTLRSLNFRKLFELDRDAVRVMRNAEGRLIGVAAVVPINEGTIPYLLEAPRSKAYFRSLTEEELKRLAVPAATRSGWFIETIDAEDFSDTSQQTAIGHLLHSLMFSGELVVESPAPFSYFTETHLSLGFEIAPGGMHVRYDGVTPAPTFVLDLRKGKLIDYIHRMMRRTGYGDMVAERDDEPGVDAAAPPNTPDPIMARADLTDREKAVAKLLERGLTNSDIASSLYISEATVKKHMRSMLSKLGAANRTQLLKKLLE